MAMGKMERCDLIFRTLLKLHVQPNANFQVIAPLFKLPVHSSTDAGDCAPHSSPTQSTLIRVAVTGRQRARPAPRRLTPIVEGRKLGKEVKVDPETVPLTGTFTVLFGSLSESLASLFASPSPLVERVHSSLFCRLHGSRTRRRRRRFKGLRQCYMKTQISQLSTTSWFLFTAPIITKHFPQ
ncbi:hypothetical protein GYMLUDRAFT_341733 [Collybiopsis luxurians FD-317 M1]|nr:hypothetical protein GYMLUDRAFT_341733 [Collybiopsis luxurians FD-317 M1]